MEWQVFHNYNELVSLGLVKPLQCPVCYDKIVIVIGEDDNPAFQCYNCSTLTVPGLNWYSDIKAVVKEFYP